jgi:hypothetical protein
MNALECLRLSRPPVCDAKEIGPHMRLGAKETWRKKFAPRGIAASDRCPFPSLRFSSH